MGDLDFLVTYCPLCGTGAVFNRKVNDTVLTFGNSSLLYLDNVLLYDFETESLWSQLLAKSITGRSSIRL